MNGLVALFRRDGRPVEVVDVQALLRAAPHRGIDSHSVDCRAFVGLGVSTTRNVREDRPGGQPYRSTATGSTIIADARLDNRDEVRTRLGEAVEPTASDAELILRAYEKWGTRGFGQLLGDFAVVIRDERRRQVLAARDPSGERQLFFRLDRASFVAASEIQQLLQAPDVTITPNERRIRDYLTPWRAYRNDQEQASTFFDGVEVVPAGHVLIVGESDHELRRFWELAVPREVHYRDDHEYVQHFADLFVAAISARLRTSWPVAAAMSGGLDSTSIVSTSQLLFQRGLVENPGFSTVSMTFDGMECDESELVRDVQAQFGFEAWGFSPLGVVSNFDPEPGAFLSRPMKSPGEIDAALAAAAHLGARTLFTGHLGDNCFGWSFRFFDSLIRRRKLIELGRQLQAYRQASGESLRRTFALHGLLPLAPLTLERRIWSAIVSRELDRERESLVPGWVNGALRDDLFRRHRDRALAAEADRRFSSVDREMMYASLYPPEALPIAGTYPVQLVRPFSDRRLHEFVLALPPEQLFQPHPYSPGFFPGSKLILRRAMRGILPESVRVRTQKPHFTAFVLRELVDRWPEYAEAFVPGRSEVERHGYVDGPAFWQRLERMRRGDFGADGVYVVRVLNLETWLRTFRLARARHVQPQTWASPPLVKLSRSERGGGTNSFATKASHRRTPAASLAPRSDGAPG